MNCHQAAEFVSALYDGETVPQEMGRHIAACPACRSRLKEYSEVGADLRLAATLEMQRSIPPQVWDSRKSSLANWWQEGWQVMRIPRFVFGLLITGILVLSSGLALVGVRAKSHGTVVMLSVSPLPGQVHPCALSTKDEKEQECGMLGVIASGELSYRIQLLSADVDTVQLGVRAKYVPLPRGAHSSYFDYTTLQELPETRYSFKPGQVLKVEVPGMGLMEVTGEWMDHVPTYLGSKDHDIDPGAGELRIVSPVLLQGKKVVGDMEGGIASLDQVGQAVDIYWPSEGLFYVSLSPLEGAVEAAVKLNRISFEVDGKAYTLITGAPISRTRRVWILLDPAFRPPQESGEAAFIGVREVPELARAPQNNQR